MNTTYGLIIYLIVNLSPPSNSIPMRAYYFTIIKQKNINNKDLLSIVLSSYSQYNTIQHKSPHAPLGLEQVYTFNIEKNRKPTF